MLKVGDVAPPFELPNQDGQAVRLSDYKGKTVVIYFYPKDMTPGCTTEACSFRDNDAAIRKRGAVVLGVSKDAPASHVKFRSKYSLPFTLLSDESTAMIQSYGAWGERSLYGRKFMGTLRITYVIGPDGKVVAAFPKVKPSEHVAEILAVLDGPKTR